MGRKNTRSDMSNINKKRYSDVHHESHNKLIGFEFKIGGVIIDLWKDKEDTEKDSRKKLSEFLVKILMWQLIAVNVFVLLSGFEFYDVNENIAKIFITGTFVELTALLGVVFAYMFKERKTDTLEILLDLFEKISRHNKVFYQEYPDDSNHNVKYTNEELPEDNEDF